jgi:hypothetical protein
VYLYTTFFYVAPRTIDTPTDPYREYIEKQKASFLSTYTKDNHQTVYSSSIDPVFYSAPDFQYMVTDEMNPIEKQWRTRILFESTPRGNILMTYDAYKMAFSYYSDIGSIPYTLLNAVAMKYVSTFRCRDFFVDEAITPTPSPLLAVHFADAQPKTAAPQPDTKKSTKPKLESTAFAKFKQYNTVSTKIEPSAKKDTITNRFVNAGKMRNISILHTVPKKFVLNKFTSSTTAALQGNAQTQQGVFSYRDFKQLQQTKAATAH